MGKEIESEPPHGVVVVSDPVDLALLDRTYSFLRDLGRCGVRLDPDFPDTAYSELYEAVGTRLYPDA